MLNQEADGSYYNSKFIEFDTKTALALVHQDAVCWSYVPEHWVLPKSKVDRVYLWVLMLVSGKVHQVNRRPGI
jgi:hypothetical protein